MKKDIKIPAVDGVAIAIVEEEGIGNEPIWNVYILNLKEEEITTVLVNSKGYGERNGAPVKTSTLRHFLEKIPPMEIVKLEPIQPEVFGLTNEFWVSFIHDGNMLDKKYIFLPESVQKSNYDTIPFIDKKGVWIL